MEPGLSSLSSARESGHPVIWRGGIRPCAAAKSISPFSTALSSGSGSETRRDGRKCARERGTAAPRLGRLGAGRPFEVVAVSTELHQKLRIAQAQGFGIGQSPTPFSAR